MAPRDEVSLAITAQMEKTQHSCVYLDLTHLPAELVQERFPHIRKVCEKFGIDITSERIPVRPGAHYMIGGVSVDLQGHTTLDGLWAAGEVTSTGLHGANRLASNSLLEGLVYGLRAGEGASARALQIPDDFTVPSLDSAPLETTPEDEELNIEDMRNSLSSLMWRQVGIQRHESQLQAAQQQIEFWDRYVSRREFNNVSGWELQNMFLVARVVIAAALARQESRGVHTRSDYPETQEKFAEHILIHSVI